MYWKSTLFALGLATGLWIQTGGDPSQAERQARERDREAAEERLSRNVETLRRMQGGWQLSELRSASVQDAGRQDVAFMVIAEEFMALEIHMGYFGLGGKEEESYLQSGTYRLNFNVFGDLVATLLIGTLDLGGGLTAPRRPGMVAIYEVEVREGRLTMTAEDSSRFIWTKLQTGPLTGRLFEELEWLQPAELEEKKAGPDSDGESGPKEK
ncbi:MAG: hypothetical protein ABGY71_13605 [bacterium]|jgi:hypothetical protein|nr:hypothetical protein [Planctomycetota bacterium]HIL50838.1 hypothetical protein [Planctomycetota bacterium]